MKCKKCGKIIEGRVYIILTDSGEKLENYLCCESCKNSNYKDIKNVA